MSADPDAIGPDTLLSVCETVSPGDQVEFATAHQEYQHPLYVRDVDVVEWLHPVQPWRTASITLEGRQGGEYPIAAVEGDDGPVVYRSSTAVHRVARLSPVDGSAGVEGSGSDGESANEEDRWCGRCGYGPSSAIGVKRHSGAVHDDDAIVVEAEPDETELVGDGGVAADSQAAGVDSPLAEPDADHKYDTGGVLGEQPQDGGGAEWEAADRRLDLDQDLGHLDVGVDTSHITLAEVVEAVDEATTQYEIGDRLRIGRNYVGRLLHEVGLRKAWKQSDRPTKGELQARVQEQVAERVDAEQPDGDDSWAKFYPMEESDD